ncbi:MAG: hypothetical protein ACOCVA_03600, partial [Prolixibacteraceae bacterium]
MREEDKYMNKVWREKLEDYSVEPPAHIWDGVQHEMAAIRKKKRMVFYSRIAAAAVVLLAFLAGWYFNAKTDDVVQDVVQNEKIWSDKKPSGAKNKPLTEDSIEESNAIQQNEKEKIQDENERKDKNRIRKELLAEAKSGKQPVEEKEAPVAFAERFSLSEIKKIEPVVSTAISEKLKEKHKVQGYTSFSEIDQNLIADNAKRFSGETETGDGWKMGVNVSPSYSSQVSSYSGGYARNMTYESSEAGVNVGGGISVQYKTGKRWSVESGVYYAKNGQKSGNSQNLFAFAAERDYDYKATPQFGDHAHFNTSIQVNNSEMVMNSTAGVIAFNRVPTGAVMAANPEESFTYSNALLTNGEFSQVFDFVEIPVYLRYLLIDSKIDVEIMGGVHAGLVVGNNVFMENEYGVQNIGQTKDISPLNISGAAGVGLNYGLSKHLSLAVEPRINYFLNSVN